MNYIQILDCSNDLGSCCNDAGLAGIIDIVRKVMGLFQTIVPIILLTMLMIQLFKLVVNPDEKGGLKKITNRIIAALIVFFLPTIVNVVMIYLPSNENFQVGACWQTAKNMSEYQKAHATSYDKTLDGKRTKLITNNTNNGTSSSSSAGRGSAMGQAIVNYALKFKGQRYVWGGTWNGAIPYTGTDCSGFVQGVFRHHGINLTRTTSTQWNDKSSYTLVSASDLRAGDLVMYSGHVAILTGNGKEIIHALNPKKGIVVTSDYNAVNQKILGFMRIKGVN